MCRIRSLASMYLCPTSVFPILPSGKPTASPEVLTAVCGQFLANLSRLGVRARAIALPSLRGLIPQPSIIISTNGRGRPVDVVLILYHHSELILIKENKCCRLSLYHAREPDKGQAYRCQTRGERHFASGIYRPCWAIVD